MNTGLKPLSGSDLSKKLRQFSTFQWIKSSADAISMRFRESDQL
ncbi:hypothetical protein ACPOL_4500 [Acidisarcina polymorpha]|uniref:Uncharacterized protein n=1 Tax=Acidisarcina polymorpha TaxID=2211140 RepID=A0A2Z5G3R4_9BACT|nr:hypothetical protein ACPOL_4500 [Acidisarcina polymorpha]